MKCKAGCGACCIAISISSSLPGMPHGKKAGVRCINLTDKNTCMVHDSVDYPRVCRDLMPDIEMCGNSFDEAFKYLSELEELTKTDTEGKDK